jgi:hypothetical protein
MQPDLKKGVLYLYKIEAATKIPDSGIESRFPH